VGPQPLRPQFCDQVFLGKIIAVNLGWIFVISRDDFLETVQNREPIAKPTGAMDGLLVIVTL